MAKKNRTSIWPLMFIAIAMFFVTLQFLGANEVESEDAYFGNSSSGGSSTSSSSLELSFERAMEQAQISQQEYLTIEQVLLALLDDPSTREFLEDNAVDIGSVRAELSSFVRSNASNAPNGGRPIPHQDVRQVSQRALMKIYSSNKKAVDGVDILEAILAENNSFAAQILQKSGLSLELTSNQVLERYLARAARDTEKLEKLVREIEEQKQFADPAQGHHIATLEPASAQSERDGAGYKSYVLLVTSDDPAVVRFKAAVSRDGRLDLYIEETPFETEFLASNVAALFETVEGGARIRVELTTEVEGQSRVVSGFGGSSGAIFIDPRSGILQRSGRL